MTCKRRVAGGVVAVLTLLLAGHLVWGAAVHYVAIDDDTGRVLDSLEWLASMHPLPAKAECASADRLWALAARNPNAALLGMSQTALERCLRWGEDSLGLARYAWVRVMRDQAFAAKTLKN